ncbi:MAG: DUF2339 domain-containing protein [Luteibacter sp.]|uniref:DUF2339 domain-containing protein n=1 Tax=Luteibacter sp. TaxID=1886636 RepID=UPI002809DDCA|nr:DUF2339 domain-containing protein [Luteibacter sp.]MDQ7997994.1 DUF2339 domain-containing protein [Luteibacter sp.]MDQ8050969.1 DUF2339 domain-containing protein [Luteibacter sp.]
MYVIWAIVCAVIGALVDQGWTGAVAGAVIGWLLGRQSQFRDELDALRTRLDAVSPGAAESTSATPVPATPKPLTPADWPDADPVRVTRPPEPAAGPEGQPGVFSSRPPPVPLSAPGAVSQAPIANRLGATQEPGTSGEPAVSREPSVPVEPAGPSLVDRWIEAGKRWFTEGNVPVKVGMLVLIAGVGAFLKYASDNGLLRVPVSVRLSIVALVAIAGVAFGWVQREKRRSFGLALQGGGLGVLVMIVFAAYRLYGLLDAGPTFALLLIFVAGMGVLAVLQDALALAVLGLIAGFAAPIMASSGQGNHVALFSYYAVLNLGILGIAWKKAWRVLNVLGFVATFGVGTAWGVLKYSPSLFESTEPFLIFHFLLFLVVPWLHVLRSPKGRRAILDGCLMFGNPIASLLLQGALLDWEPMPLAISALIAAGLYIAIAFAIRKREDMGLLRETWAVLAVAFATIAVPLALSAAVTASVFALEGAGLIWLGFRQGRRLPRWSGVFLQLVAGVAWCLALAFRTRYRDTAFLNPEFIGSLLLVVGAGVGVWQFDRHGTSRGVSSLARVGLLLWAGLWWFVGFGNEIGRFVRDAGDTGIPANVDAAWLALVGVTGWLLAEACPRTRKLDLGAVLAFSVPLSFLFSLLIVLQGANERVQWLAGWPLGAVVVMAVTGWLAMRGEGTHRVAGVATSTVWWLRWLALFTLSIGLALDHVAGVGQGWQIVACSVPTLLIAAITAWWPRLLASPLAIYLREIRVSVGGAMVLAMAVVGLIALTAAGSPQPLPFVPVLNPLDLLLIAVLLFTARAISDEAVPPAIRRTRPAALAVAFFIVATSMTLRAVHHLGGVPWDSSMPSSSLAELSLTVVWSVIGVVAWVLGSRRGQRLLWMAGAGTMAVVLLKLLLVDRGHLGNLFGIASFIAYGLLCTVIGYLAPAPPKEGAVIVPESPHAS